MFEMVANCKRQTYSHKKKKVYNNKAVEEFSMGGWMDGYKQTNGLMDERMYDSILE